MNPINQDNLYLILPYKVSQLAMLISKKLGVPILDAIRTVYDSNTYRELEREDTKLWHLGPVGLYEHFQIHH